MHYTNLQPMTRAENASKHKKLPSLQQAAKVDRDRWPDNVDENDLN